jgi:hypothetical protein
MRELIIKKISDMGWLDYTYRSYKDDVLVYPDGVAYSDWLTTLSDIDLLETYRHMQIMEYIQYND